MDIGVCAKTGATVMSVNPNKNKMNVNGTRYLFNILYSSSNDDCLYLKPSEMVSVCWTYYIIGEVYL